MKFKIYLLILALMLCVGQDAWGEVTGTYNSSTKTLNFSGTGEVTSSIVHGVPNYEQATKVTFGSGITVIGSYAFLGTGLTSVTIPSSVTIIREKAFYGCSSLATVTFSSGTSTLAIESLAFGTSGSDTGFSKLTFNCYRPFTYVVPTSISLSPSDYTGFSGLFHNASRVQKVVIGANVKTLPSDTFHGCSSLASLDMANAGDLTSIGNSAFSGCRLLSSVSIPSSVKNIGVSAFLGTGLTSVTIPSSVTSIEEYAFCDCSSLATVTFSSGTSTLSIRGLAFGTDGSDKDFTKLTFNCFRPFTYSNTINSSLSPYNQTYTGIVGLFNNASRVQKVVIGGNVTDIPNYTFYGCTNLLTVTILGNPTIGSQAFPSNTKISDESTVTYGVWLALYAGEKSTMTELRIPNDNVAGYSYTTTANLNKEFPKLKKVIFGEKVTKIGNAIFYVENGKTNNLETVVFEGEPVAVGSGSFYRCSKLANIQGSIKSVGDGSFGYCSSLRAVELTDDTELECAFADCTSLQSIVLPNNLKTIAAWDFQNCTALTSITIPSSVTSVNKYSFWNCTNLKTVIINSASVVNPSTSYTSTLNLGTIFPNASTFQLGDAVTAIGANAFYGCSKITSFVIPANVTTINTTAFDGCTNLTDLTIASNTIASKAWTSSSNMTNMNTIFPNLKKVVFGENVKAIGENAFSVPSDKTNNIETIVFEGDPVDVGSSAFRYNTKLAKIGKVKSVGTSSFSNCSSLESIEITGDDVVDASAFSACSSLKSVTLPNTLTTINQYAFNGCTELTSIDIPSNVTSINVEAFRNCTNLSNLKVSSNTLASKNWTSSSNMNTIFPNLQKVVFGKDVKAIGENMFYMPDKSNNIETVVFEGNPVDVGSYAFYYNTNLAKIEGNVKSVSASSFACCSGLESVSISDDATIERNAFAFCYSLKSVTLPTTLTTIEQYAFNKCRSMTSIEIPSRVTSIDANAFNGATSLSKVKISSASVVNPSTPYDATYNLGKIFPCATEVELNLLAWNPVIGDYAFYGATALKSVIAGSVLQRISEIGANAFKGCTNLVLGDDPKFKNTWGYVKTIGESAFEGCTSLKLDELPTNLTTINAATFSWCM